MARSFSASILLLLAGCAGAGSAPPDALPPSAVSELEVRALLLLLVDRQVYEPVAVEQALRGGADLREELAVALGRIPEPQGRWVLEGLLLDDQPRVRRAAAFGLGELEEEDAADALFRAVADPDRETAVLAVEALGKLGASAVDVAQALLPLSEEERWARLLPHLFRFRQEAKVTLAERGLAVTRGELRGRAAYALARDPLPAAAPALRRLLADPEPRLRAWAARGLGEVGDGSDLPRLRPLLDDADPGPAIQALLAARRLLDAGKGAPPESFRPRLAALLADPRAGVRLAALEAAGAWPFAPGELGEALAARAAEGHGRERGLAVVALARSRHPRAGELAARAAAAPDPDVRARAAEAAGVLKAADLIDRLWQDEAPLVRQAVLTARLAAAGEAEAPGVAAEGARDPDAGVRTVALEWLAGHPTLPARQLGEALAATLTDRTVESGMAAVRAVAARAEAAAGEREDLADLLEAVARDRRYPLRREAQEALARLGRAGRQPPPLGPAAAERPLAVYREMVARTREPRTVEIRTPKGAVRVRLACPQAPLTCLNFLQLAGQGFFDGQTFHRVVPDYVVQGGDPRGDGYGGPPYTVVDEINRLRYGRGVVGMALAGPDTGGSQFFFTLSPQPHLDGGYTAFGEVVAGLEVLDRLQPYDRIEKVVALTP